MPIKTIVTTGLGGLAGLGVALAPGGCGDNVAPPEPGALVIAGHVWSDDDLDGTQGASEAGLAGFDVFLDLDDDGAPGAGEPAARTDATGAYELPVDAPGTYVVRQVLPFGWRSPISDVARLRRVLGGPGGPAPIIGGSIAVPGAYPFMVAVGQLDGGQVWQFCGGVLVTDRHVVTAAHCTEGSSPSEVGVLVGTHDLDAGGQAIAVERLDLHPDYGGEGHDIAVWTLAEPIDLAASGLYTVEMAAPETAALAAAGTLASTLGWGVSDAPGSQLQHVHLPIVDEATCLAAYPDASSFATEICAGVAEGGIDSCQGDSGGPLIVRDPDREVWVHAGITSWGYGCAEPGLPGVYARVSVLSAWAKSMMIEPGGAVHVTVTVDDGAATADFPTRATTRAMTAPIEPRWQLTALTLPAELAPDVPVDASWRLIGDPGVEDGAGFSCSIDPDGAAALPAQDVACGMGETHVSLAGLPTGIYPAQLTVTRAGQIANRRVNVFVGEPAAVDTTGQLSALDPVDPDYPDEYFVDYYDVTGLDGTLAFAIELRSTAFDPFLTLYDADARDPVTGGGILDVGAWRADGSLRLVVVPTPGRRYSIGVSSYAPEDTGTYEVRIINDGVLAPP